jgi:hypothetical protein
MPPVHRTLATAETVRAIAGTDPVTTRALHAAGVTDGAVRAAVRSGRLVRLRDGVVALPLPDAGDEYAAVRRRALAVLLRLHATAAASHGTGGVLHRLPERRPGRASADEVVVTAARSGRRQRGLRIVSAELDLRDIEMVAGVRCTSVARTALDLALGRPLPESLVVLDAAVTRVGLDVLGSAFTRLGRIRGTGALVDAMALADARAESPLESASRGVIIEARLPRPELQQWIADDEGRSWRVDFLWREQRVIGEADGWVKYESIAELRAEKIREDSLRRAGWTIVRWTSDELWRTPQVVVARIARALAGVR